MSVHSTHTIDAGRSLVSEALRWALPRLGIYLLTAVGSVVAFTVWAAVYTYVWPGKQIEPPVPPAPSIKVPSTPIPVPAPPRPSKRITEEGPLVSSVLPAAPAGIKVYMNDQLVGHVETVSVDPTGSPYEVGVRLDDQFKKIVVVPTKAVEWKRRASPDGDVVGIIRPGT